MYTTSFMTVSDIAMAADLINRPHEDYPKRVETTKHCINVAESHIISSDSKICAYFLRMMHQFVMYDLPNRGTYRKCHVTINGKRMPSYIQVPSMMDQIVPIQFTSVDQLQDWYCQFETIHPFSDGNGRVGGIILAAVSYIRTGSYMVEGINV